MSLSIVFIYLFASIKLTSSRSFFQTAHLKPSSATTVSGIAVNAGPGATVVDDQWFIDVISQQGSDLNIVMDSRWGFHDSFVSSIELYIEGRTTNETYDTDGEILFVFNVDEEYFAEMISIDARKSSYKECPSSDDSLITRDVIEMMSSSVPDRYHRFCKNTVNTPNTEASDNWHNAGFGSLSYKQPAQWPMIMRVTNNPLTNTVSYTWTDAINGLVKVSSEFSTSFTPNRGLNIFISGESPNEDYYIYSVDITYRYEVITPEPSTVQPTNTPTDKPTLKPTTSLSPTIKPSVSPTSKPTDAPTATPSWSPTIFGETRAPSNKPSTTPTTQNDEAATFVTVIVNFNPTKILFIQGANDGAISWFQAMIIIVAVFVFIVAWVGFSAFVYFVKRKPKSKKQKDRKYSHSNQGEDECELEEEAAAPGGTIGAQDYISESAMLATQKEHVPDFLNINMQLQSNKLYQHQYKLNQHQYELNEEHDVNNMNHAQYNVPATPPQHSHECEAESPPMTPNLKARTSGNQAQYLDFSETSPGPHSETDELSRHDMIYIPGKQTKYREKYKASIMRQQSTKQYKRYKQSVQSLDI